MPDAPRPIRPPFRRFSPKIGWPETGAARVGVPEGDGPLVLAPSNKSALPITESFGSFGGATLPKGFAIHSDGYLFLVDPGNHVVLHAHATELTEGTQPFTPLWSPRDGPGDAYHLSAPVDVAVTPTGDLVIVDAGTTKVLILDWPSGTLRADLVQPGWRPVAVAVLPCGSILIADDAQNTIHRYDPTFRLVPDWMREGTSLTEPSALAAVMEPDAPRDPVVLVLDRGRVVGLDAQGRETESTDAALTPPALQKDGTGFTFDDPRWPRRTPLRIPYLETSRDGRLAGTSLPIIAVPRRIEIPLSGKLIFDAVDSGKRGFQWDRIALDLALPDSARLLVRTLTSDAEIAVDQITRQPDSAWSAPLEIAPGALPETLVQSGPGQYLWLWIDLFSDGTISPEIHRIDLYGPRQSGLQHLPAPFHSDPQSRDFLDRSLSYFDTIFAELRQQADDMGAYFDPYAVPEGQWLQWLGGWFDLSFLTSWDAQTRREMIAHAIDSARERGTQAGLSRMLRWHLDIGAPWPGIVEHFRLGPTPPPIGHVPLPMGPDAHRLTIILPRASVPAEQEARLRRLIDGWLPAHVGYDLRFIEPGLVVGHQSTPGLDTYLGISGGQPLGAGRAGLDFSTKGTERGLRLPSDPISHTSIGDCHGR